MLYALFCYPQRKVFFYYKYEYSASTAWSIYASDVAFIRSWSGGNLITYLASYDSRKSTQMPHPVGR